MSYIVSKEGRVVNRKIDYKYLSSDIVFKYIFGTDENKKYTAKFLELFMNISPVLLDDIVIENSVKITPKTVNKRKYELDVIVVIPKLNMKVILEMQNELNNNTLSKNIIYLLLVILRKLCIIFFSSSYIRSIQCILY